MAIVVKLGMPEVENMQGTVAFFKQMDEFFNDHISIKDAEVCHYFPCRVMDKIIKNKEVLFSDVEFLNDKEEEENIWNILLEILNNLDESQYNTELIKSIKRLFETKEKMDNYIRYNYDGIYRTEEQIIEDEKDDFIYNARRFVFCTSMNFDCLPMWSYYSKDNKYEAYGITFLADDVKRFIEKNVKDVLPKYNIKMGKVIYDDAEKSDLILNLLSQTNKMYLKEINTHRKTERRKILTNYSSRFFYLIKSYAPFFKNQYYKHEEEYRFLIELDNTMIRHKKLKHGFRQVGALWVPYITIGFDPQDVRIFILNPSDGSDLLVQKSIDAYLQCYDYNTTSIGRSTIPLRY